MLAVRLPAELEQRLDALSKKTGRPKSFYMREALERQLEDIEDTYLAEAAYGEFLKSGGKTTSLADVKKQLGLDN
jgi:RHH-type transcriptional regulator, rel operon repressor / antitoxin RelB